jgi:hypothetical protein
MSNESKKQKQREMENPMCKKECAAKRVQSRESRFIIKKLAFGLFCKCINSIWIDCLYMHVHGKSSNLSNANTYIALPYWAGFQVLSLCNSLFAKVVRVTAAFHLSLFLSLWYRMKGPHHVYKCIAYSKRGAEWYGFLIVT